MIHRSPSSYNGRPGLALVWDYSRRRHLWKHDPYARTDTPPTQHSVSIDRRAGVRGSPPQSMRFGNRAARPNTRYFERRLARPVALACCPRARYERVPTREQVHPKECRAQQWVLRHSHQTSKARRFFTLFLFRSLLEVVPAHFPLWFGFKKTRHELPGKHTHGHTKHIQQTHNTAQHTTHTT